MLGLLRLLVVGILLLPAELSAQEARDLLHIHFLDVGQGDAVLIEAPTGQRVLIDSGPDGAVVDHLLHLGVDTLHLFITSHNHADHLGGAEDVLRAFPVRFYMDNGVPHTTATYRRVLETLLELDVPLLEPEEREIELGGVLLHILPPPGDPSMGQNDNSIGVVLRHGAFRASFGGDAEGALWRHWLQELPDAFLETRVHKASHHGSRNGDIAEAMERLRPTLVVVSAGRNNPYGHPHGEAVELYAAMGAQVLNTAHHGTVTVRAQRTGRFHVSTSGVQEAPAEGCVDLNSASFDELQGIAHIGPGRAGQIELLRGQRPFGSVEELTRVRGIGPARLRDILTQGVACAGAWPGG